MIARRFCYPTVRELRAAPEHRDASPAASADRADADGRRVGEGRPRGDEIVAGACVVKNGEVQ
jgi:hypothetical protein